MRIHILGICGTFMGGLAVLASELKHKVTGSDQNIYPPMSTQLDKLGVKIFQGYQDPKHLDPTPDYTVVGNVMARGMPVIETLLNQNLPMLSGPEWLGRFVLHDRHVLAVAGTHGKTTTSSMVAWILEYADLDPGFLIGGVPNNFGVSARLGKGSYFVVEADEYDCAFFDKRSKFIHYKPRTLIINNIEFDHADIFSDLAAIQQQFHHLVRVVPGKGLIVYPDFDENIVAVLQKGCWTKTVSFSINTSSTPSVGWHAKNQTASGDAFEVCFQEISYGRVQWSLLGQHNIQNALAAIAAVQDVNVDPTLAVKALCHFEGVKRRMEVKGIKRGITVYDDFAHHPTAIGMTLAGLRAKVGKNTRIVAVVDIRSNTMKAGHHQTELASSMARADHVYFFHSPNIAWDVKQVLQSSHKPGGVYTELQPLVDHLLNECMPQDHVIFMSNGGFGGIHARFLEGINSV